MDITPNQIEKMIYVIRGQKVMLDSDLSKLYKVETKVLKRAVSVIWSAFPLILCLNYLKKS